jgi:hypothetical protein
MEARTSFIIPLSFIIALVLRHYLMGLIYISALLFASVIYYRAFNIKGFLSIIVVILARIIRSYGYVARRLLKGLRSRILS